MLRTAPLQQRSAQSLEDELVLLNQLKGNRLEDERSSSTEHDPLSTPSMRSKASVPVDLYSLDPERITNREVSQRDALAGLEMTLLTFTNTEAALEDLLSKPNLLEWVLSGPYYRASLVVHFLTRFL